MLHPLADQGQQMIIQRRQLTSVGHWLLYHLTTVINHDILKFRVSTKLQVKHIYEL